MDCQSHQITRNTYYNPYAYHVSNNSDRIYNNPIHKTAATRENVHDNIQEGQLTTDGESDRTLHTDVNDVFKIGFLNVDGLKSKRKFHDLDDHIKNYNIICFAETFMTEKDFDDPLNDTQTLPGFRIYHKIRKEKTASGGIAIAVRNEINTYVSHVPNNCDNLLWCKIDKCLLNVNEDVYFACVYISPEGSPHSEPACFSNIETEVLTFNEISQSLFLIGDFNSHISTKLEFVPNGDELFSDRYNEHDIDLSLSAENILSSLQLPVNRNSDDAHRVNNWGKYLLACLFHLNFIVCNGRFGCLSSKCTTVHDTIVDYFICSPYFLQNVLTMQVLDFNPILSDVHMPLEISIKSSLSKCILEDSNEPAHTQNIQHTEKANKWDCSKQTEFINNLDMTHIQGILGTLNETVGNENTQEQLDIIMNEISTLFLNSGLKTFGKKKNFSKKRKKATGKGKDKPWYNTVCRNKRIIFNRARKKFQITKSQRDFEDMKLFGKEYKREIIKSHMTYSDQVRCEIRQMRAAANKKAYWKYCKTRKIDNNPNNLDFQRFTDFFKSLNEKKENTETGFLNNNNTHSENNDVLDQEITVTEIKNAILKLKNNKACGIDNIINEHIKSTVDCMMPVYVKMFNIVYSSGIIPDSWRTGIIKPIYKKKGPRNDPDFYRPISILSCMAKLFTSILNTRLTKYLDEHKAIGEEQLGFRENYSTTDGIFIVHFLSELLKSRGKNLMCAFIDIKKCFPSIWRDGLWHKLSSMKLGSKMFTIIHSLYKCVKSCLVIDGQDESGNKFSKQSEMFVCGNGLREGECLSPLLFSLYVNDLNNYFIENACIGVSLNCIQDDVLIYYCKLLLLMYADDTVLFATTAKDLKHSLKLYSEYCSQWKLDINVEKTKIVCFGIYRKPIFKLYNQEVEVVNIFNYLGITFSKNGRFTNAMKNNITKATKAMHTLRRTFYDKNIPIDCQIDMFEKTIEPILLYGAEIWGAENTTIIEKYHLKVMKQILGVRPNTPTYMVLGETGKLPLRATIDKRIFKFWYRLVTGKKEKLSYQIYKVMTLDKICSGISYKWLDCVEKILNDSGNAYIWARQNLSLAESKLVVKTLQDQQIQNLYSNRDSSAKARNYLHLKNKWEIEFYLKHLDYRATRQILRFRTSNHKLPIEIGRYAQPKIPAHLRYCPFCVNLVGDAFHYVLECNHFNQSRKKYLDKEYTSRPSMYKFLKLMQTKDIRELCNLATFANLIMNKFK